MPVELPYPQRETAAPKAPRPIIWLMIFLIILAIGMITMLLTWPKDQPTYTPWFWVRLLLLPALAGSLAFGFRQLYYEQESKRYEAKNMQLAADRAEAIQFAREPLSIVSSAYLSALGGSDVAIEIAKKAQALQSQKSAVGSAVVRHTRLERIGNLSEGDRYEACFVELLERMDETLSVLPERVPLEVYLQIPHDADWDDIQAQWSCCWSEFGYRPVEAAPLSNEEGVMALDAWLDIEGGPALEKFALFVAVQLDSSPRPNGAEAATALLFGWAPLVMRKGLTSKAFLHRPVDARDDTVRDALERALIWGDAEAGQVHDLWQAGLERADKAALLDASSDLESGVSEGEGFPGVHDIDVAIGDAGIDAAWLAIALAAEHAVLTAKSQVMASRERSLRLAVIQPAGVSQEAKQ
ncbi:hypothetical protein F4827_006088 [Paraburkholderia bannensis]|uniref:Uncharacterized protein n=1 Tax=Paraburkholderia bannensis TaxID=765414 RepID=A0A7W9U379_9BURK|nr:MULTISPECIES: hypothetical protein [Paraburkholderia]MBB3261180.1 hypothetical protein [Paraburkholderia sp. WP4_3_2]MBB6106217.1 hypothetical protein [Paraburkholderia bannensis]